MNRPSWHAFKLMSHFIAQPSQPAAVAVGGRFLCASNDGEPIILVCHHSVGPPGHDGLFGPQIHYGQKRVLPAERGTRRLAPLGTFKCWLESISNRTQWS